MKEYQRIVYIGTHSIYGTYRGHQILLLIYRRDVRTVGLFTDDLTRAMSGPHDDV